MTHYYYLDASALVKRYTFEPGSATMHELIERLLPLRPSRLLISWLGFLEIAAVLNRHRNDGRLTERIFQQTMIRLSDEAEQMHFLPVNDDVATRALALVLQYNLNASDALYLQQIKDWQTTHDLQEDNIVLVAADERLLRAAQAEGIDTLSPASDSLDKIGL